MTNDVIRQPPATVPAAGDMLPLFSKEVAETINTNYFGLKVGDALTDE